MATTQDVHAPTLGAQGEPCASCGSPLAADQRYCLERGARRAQARIAFREILGRQGPLRPPLAPATVAEERVPASGLAFLGGLVCLLLALGVGVLIGRSGDNTPTAATPAPAAQVISVGGAAPAATTPATTATTPADSAGSSSGTDSSSGSAKGSGSSKGSSGSKASNKAVKDLNNTSGTDYQKKSQKLPKQVGTGGKPPPKDNKPAGGGSGFQDIG